MERLDVIAAVDPRPLRVRTGHVTFPIYPIRASGTGFSNNIFTR
jgi:hypothetical protein